MKNLIKLEKNLAISITNQIYEYMDVSCIYIPYKEPCSLKEHAYIYKNTLINNSFTSISGYLEYTPKYLKIVNDFQENSQNKLPKMVVHKKDELINLLSLLNLNELKDKINNISEIKHLVISSIDEEDYSLKEFMTLANYYQEILETINYLIKLLSLKEASIVTKDTFSSSILKVKSVLGTYPNIHLHLLPDLFLISEKNNLCHYLNFDIQDTLILTSTDILNMYYGVLKHKYLDSTIVTISGNNLKKSLVIKTKIGVSLTELIDKYITIIDDNYDIFINGVLLGTKVKSFKNIIITPSIHTIVINKKEVSEECINCGACLKICPVNINVKKCFQEKKHHLKCLNCGLCNYICPSKIDLKRIVGENKDEEINY